ncbi:MAG: hypothetical protein ACRDNL_08495 [Spirillospora sp.]
MNDMMTDQDLMFDLDLRVVADDQTAAHEWGTIHTTYVTELCMPSDATLCVNQP